MKEWDTLIKLCQNDFKEGKIMQRISRNQRCLNFFSFHFGTAPFEKKIKNVDISYWGFSILHFFRILAYWVNTMWLYMCHIFLYKNIGIPNLDFFSFFRLEKNCMSCHRILHLLLQRPRPKKNQNKKSSICRYIPYWYEFWVTLCLDLADRQIKLSS